jgi:hypothetical protein
VRRQERYVEGTAKGKPAAWCGGTTPITAALMDLAPSCFLVPVILVSYRKPLPWLCSGVSAPGAAAN